MTNYDPKNKHFKDNIRSYNSMFCYTSVGGKIETSINDGSATPQFILSGQKFHRIRNLIPSKGKVSKFAQL